MVRFNKKMSWGYGHDNGPDEWHNLYPIADGNSQSPVDIVTASAVYDEGLASNTLALNYSPEKELTIINTGHSVSAKINGVSELSGGPLRNRYRLEQFHLHWGATDNRGSEHTIDSCRFAGELHLVHWNCDKYVSFADAVDKPDGLAVVGVMIKVGQEHKGFSLICENVGTVKETGSKFSIPSAFNPLCLLPATNSYWTYHGSLTTPPLFESVDWIVLKESIEFSKEQIESLRCLKYATGSSMQDNFRPPCPMKGRQLLKSYT